VGVVGISGTPGSVGKYLKLVITMTELMVKQLILMEETEWQNRTRELILEDILSNSPNYEKFFQRCSLLNIHLEAPYDMFVIKVKEDENLINTKSINQSFYQNFKNLDSIHGFIDLETFLIIFSNKKYSKDKI